MMKSFQERGKAIQSVVLITIVQRGDIIFFSILKLLKQTPYSFSICLKHTKHKKEHQEQQKIVLR